MKIMIAGASGLIGTALVDKLTAQHELTLVGRSKSKLHKKFPNIKNLLTWAQLSTQQLANQDVVVNLCGENVGKGRWSPSRKQQIIASRVDTSAQLAQFCCELGSSSPRLLNASAIGIYGLMDDVDGQNNTIFNEHSPLPKKPTDFLSQVALEWEDALAKAEKVGVRVTYLRFGVVLSDRGGALTQMLPAFKLGLGAIIGNGKQPFSWVLLEDAIAAIIFLIERKELTGPFNIVADEVVSQQQFATELASAVKRPCFMRLPSGMVEILFGQMGRELLLNGQHIEAKRLAAAGFKFTHPTIKSALKSLFN